jgi:hypothetical protein
MFYPIFDDKTERWQSALIIWAKASSFSRFFDQNEDVTYCSAFAHSLRADLPRIEIAASDAAKGTFISSISHELWLVELRQQTYVYRCVYADNLQYVSLQTFAPLRCHLSPILYLRGFLTRRPSASLLQSSMSQYRLVRLGLHSSPF